MKKGMILLADGFEESETLVTVDLLRRSQIDIDLISMMDSKNVVSAHHIKVETDFLISEIDYQNYQFLILPGGQAVFHHLQNDLRVKEMIHFFMNQKRLIAAICAAPLLLGELGYLKDKNYICFKGCEQDAFLGILNKDKDVVCDGNIITARSMYYTCDFALAIIQKLQDAQQAENIRKQIQSKE